MAIKHKVTKTPGQKVFAVSDWNAEHDGLDDGTAVGQIAFWDGTKWVPTETSEVFWDDVNKRIELGVNSFTNPAGGRLRIDNGAILFKGTLGATPTSGHGTRLMWIPSKAAFRAGSVSYGGQWDDANIGNKSIAFGHENKANGYSSTAFGTKSTASGTYSTCFGYNGSASSVGATHFGYNGIASGAYSTHFGDSGKAEGDYSWVGGRYMQLSSAADNSFAFGHHSSAVALTQPNTFYIFPGGTAGKVAVGTTTPAPSAAVDITSTAGALLLSRMTTAQRDALTAVNGMIIYNTTTNAFNFYENGAWVTK